MSILKVEGLKKSYGQETILNGLSLSIEEGELLSIVGPSGSGKTTMLRCMSGLLPFEEGSVTIAGQPVNGPPETLGLVFQDYSRSLLPWLTVQQNVELPLKYKALSREDREAFALDALKSVGLDKHREKHPWQLSGGMQQRVAIARALAYQPKILLMDEPFASVDAQTRVELEDLTLTIWRERAMTIGFVTHDIDEAIYLGNRVAVLSKSPTVIHQVFDVDLPQPRDQVKTKALSSFGEMRGMVFDAIGRHPASTR